jgi:lipoate-protein ligase A
MLATAARSSQLAAEIVAFCKVPADVGIIYGQPLDLPLMSLPTFDFVTTHERPFSDGVACEAGWMAGAAAHGRALAHLWEGVPGLVVPRSYERLPLFAVARERWVADGLPVRVRASGGGLVPQGPGVQNLTLVWPADPAATPDIARIYESLCGELATAFARLGIAASAQAVEGSFCDGRYNLAVDGRKLVGTAQSWRRIGGRQVVLAHAVIVVDADPQALTAEADAFERAIESGRRYRAEALTSVARAWRAAHSDAVAPADLAARCRQVVAEQFARTPTFKVHTG